MKILYITPLVAGFEDILRGKPESRGLPSFIFPLQALIERGHEVAIILISNYREPIDIQADWVKNENIVANINYNLVDGPKAVCIWNKVKGFLALVKVLWKYLSNGDYDFVYCHGKAGLLGNYFANWYGVKIGYRIYGTIDLAKSIREKGVLFTAFLQPVYFAIFNTRKEFMLITDDGTEGDFVYDKFALKKKFRCLFWLNGIEKEIAYTKCEQVPPDATYMFHAARVCRPKAQHKNLALLYKLRKSGVPVKLYFAGHIEEPGYKHELDLLIRKYNLSDAVTFLGDMNREDLQNFARNALAVPLFADFNQGNVLLECMMAGAVVVTFYEEPLTRFLVDGQNGFFVKDIDDAARKIKTLYEMPDAEIERMRTRAKESIDEKLLSWEQRVQKEVKLIESMGKRQL